MKYITLCAAFCLLFVSACEDAEQSSAIANLGTFFYTAADTLGNTVARGVLMLHTENTKVSGSWQFQNGRRGELEGNINNDTIDLNLNPGFVDNNLLLHGTLAGNVYSGEWQQIGFPGVMAQGRFYAVKK